MYLIGIFRLGVLGVWLLAGNDLFADDWPQWLGPNRDAVWREDGIIEKFTTLSRSSALAVTRKSAAHTCSSRPALPRAGPCSGRTQPLPTGMSMHAMTKRLSALTWR